VFYAPSFSNDKRDRQNYTATELNGNQNALKDYLHDGKSVIFDISSLVLGVTLAGFITTHSPLLIFKRVYWPPGSEEAIVFYIDRGR
jgi:hypothetical protein